MNLVGFSKSSLVEEMTLWRLQNEIPLVHCVWALVRLGMGRSVASWPALVLLCSNGKH